MALIVFDGFDHYTGIADLQARKGVLQWSDLVTYDNAVTFATGRGGYGQCVGLSATSSSLVQFGGAFGTYLASGFVGCAILNMAECLSPWMDIQIMDYVTNAPQITARLIAASGVVQIYCGEPGFGNMIADTGVFLAQSAPNTFSPYIWNYIEIGFSIASTATGSVDVHVNGNSVFSVTGVITQGVPSQSNASGFRIRPARANGVTGVASPLIDDFYVCDGTTGPGTYPCNTFLGDSACRTLFTTANSSVQWTPLTGANWIEVGETQFDSDTSYNYATTVGETDLFTFGSLPTTVAAVLGVQTTGAYRKLDAGANTITQEISSNGTIASGSAHNLSLSYSYNTDLFVLDPNTGNTFSPAAVNRLVAGYKLSS